MYPIKFWEAQKLFVFEVFFCIYLGILSRFMEEYFYKLCLVLMPVRKSLKNFLLRKNIIFAKVQTPNNLCIVTLYIYYKTLTLRLLLKVCIKVFSSGQVKTVVPVLACSDRLLRVLREAEVVYSVEVPSVPTCLHLFYGDGGETGDLVLYGTSDGGIGLVQLGR